jgi:hypothetical protein
VHDLAFIAKLTPSIAKQQVKYSPTGASFSKSPSLLKNTFSVEMYGEFQRARKLEGQSGVEPAQVTAGP